MLSLSSSPAKAFVIIPSQRDCKIREAVGAGLGFSHNRLITRLITFIPVTAFLLFAADPALAQAIGGAGGGTGDITTFLQNLVNLITGTAGKLIAVLAICFVGIGALMGALSLRAAGGVIFGVMLIFSASWIVTQIVG